MAGKVENKKIRGIWKWELLLALVIHQRALIIASFSEEDNWVSQTDNFVNANVFNSVIFSCLPEIETLQEKKNQYMKLS